MIFTNGVMFPHPGFIERVVALGSRVEWRVSIQGGNEDAHVAVTGRPDSFRRIEQGLRTLAALGQRVTANNYLEFQHHWRPVMRHLLTAAGRDPRELEQLRVVCLDDLRRYNCDVQGDGARVLHMINLGNVHFVPLWPARSR